jgi:hypothetical protein
MRIYLSAPRARREEVKGYRADLQALNHEVLGSWIDDADLPEEGDETPLPASIDAGGLDPGHGGSDMSFSADKEVPNMQSARDLELAARAARIYAEIIDCDALVVFTDRKNHTREQAYAEYAGALFRGKRVWIVGERYHDMHYFRDVLRFSTWVDFLAMLKARKRMEEKTG